MAHALPEQAIAAADGRWSDFWTRFASAAILGPIALAALWWGGLAWALLVGVAMAGLGLEWAQLTRRDGSPWLPAWLVLVWCAAGMFGTVYGIAALLVLTAMTASRHGWFAAAGLPYAGIGGLAVLWLRAAPAHGLADTLFVVMVVWGTDIGAYGAGRIFGGRKLAPQISPGKTLSGAIGGLAIGAVAGAALAAGWHGHAATAALAAAALSISAQAGDLLESAIKRKLGVKDSGTTIPGHGGLFDRLDGFLTAAPLAALAVVLAQGGLPLWR